MDFGNFCHFLPNRPNRCLPIRLVALTLVSHTVQKSGQLEAMSECLFAESRVVKFNSSNTILYFLNEAAGVFEWIAKLSPRIIDIHFYVFVEAFEANRPSLWPGPGFMSSQML